VKLAAIRDQAADAVAEVARDAAAEIVGSFGVSVDAGAVSAAVDARLKG
jgi:F-type H+-transporting ATPase subunit b